MNEIAKPIITQRADPFVMRHTDGWYYFTASVPEYDRIELRRAKTIEGLADCEPVVLWNRHDSGEMSYHIWAPEIHYLDGKWYIYFAASQKEDIWRIRPYVIACDGQDPMCGPWRELGQLRADGGDDWLFSNFSLDVTVFEHGGQAYIIWAQKTGGSDDKSNLYLSKLVNPWTVASDYILLTEPEFPWECVGFKVNEGLAVLEKKDRIFVTFSASATDSNYCVGLLWADANRDIMDISNWKKCPEPVMKTNEKAQLYGPGHNSFTVDGDGKDIMVFHGRNYKEIVGDPLYDPNRHTYVGEVLWKDGFPVFPFSER